MKKLIRKTLKKGLDFIGRNEKGKRHLLRKYVGAHNWLYHKITEIATDLNGGIHPKHKIINYHKYFVDRVEPTSTVVDIGCGAGILAYNVAKKAKSVIGIDISENNIKFANEHYKRDNLKFILGDATTHKFQNKFDVAILSNVLEHIEDRVKILKDIAKLTDVLLLRVPMENRDWLTIYKKEQGFEYMLDETHFLEYRVETVEEEAKQSGWRVESYQINWGEFWGKLVKKDD